MCQWDWVRRLDAKVAECHEGLNTKGGAQWGQFRKGHRYGGRRSLAQASWARALRLI